MAQLFITLLLFFIFLPPPPSPPSVLPVSACLSRTLLPSVVSCVVIYSTLPVFFDFYSAVLSAIASSRHVLFKSHLLHPLLRATLPFCPCSSSQALSCSENRVVDPFNHHSRPSCREGNSTPCHFYGFINGPDTFCPKNIAFDI